MKIKNNLTLYHGSPTVIKDIAMASGTYFSDDLEVARSYGNYIYKIECDYKTKTMFIKAIFNEHYITIGHIPFYVFEILL